MLSIILPKSLFIQISKDRRWKKRYLVEIFDERDLDHPVSKVLEDDIYRGIGLSVVRAVDKRVSLGDITLQVKPFMDQIIELTK